MDYVVSPKVKEIVDKMVSLDAVKKGLEFIKEDNDQTVQNQLDLAMIPSPTFHEQEKAKALSLIHISWWKVYTTWLRMALPAGLTWPPRSSPKFFRWTSPQ